MLNGHDGLVYNSREEPLGDAFEQMGIVPEDYYCDEEEDDE